MTVLHIDFETRSAVDLKEAGLDNYARHPSTDVWCCAWVFGSGGVNLWDPLTPDIAYSHMLSYVEHGGIVLAHNAAFELAIWNHIMVPRYGWPPLKPEQCRCTMAMAYAMALPGDLERAAAAAGIQEQKDTAGRRLMLQMSRPRSAETPHPDAKHDRLVWWDDGDKLEKLYAYCKQDVVVERELGDRLMPLSDAEQEMWVIDQRINSRGVYVDRAAVRAAVAVVQQEQDRLNKEMRRVTDNYVGFCTEAARITKWVQSRGVPVDGIAKADVLDALDREDLPGDVRAALLLRQEAGKSSTAKLTAMLAAVSGDGRLRGMFQYHGAGTGRWAGRRVQLQNLPRSPEWFTPEVAEEIIAGLTRPDAAEWIRFFYGAPLDVISYLLRPMLCAAPGHDLLAADFANIESRALAWLAGEEWKLDAFRAYDAGTGPDLYKLGASRILGKPIEAITKDERQTYGKVPELACGYQGGVGAFQRMAKTYLVKVPDAVAESAKIGWRGAHQKIERYWYALEDAAITAVMNPGGMWRAGFAGRQVAFKVKGSFLWCLLPSGRVLCYPYPKLKAIETPWGEMKDQVHYMTVDGLSGKWVETHTYGGKLAENVTQAVCRDLLAEAIKRCEMRGFEVVMHVHDEVVVEESSGASGAVLQQFERVCSELPKWAEGLPVVAKGWRGKRYRK